MPISESLSFLKYLTLGEVGESLILFDAVALPDVNGAVLNRLDDGDFYAGRYVSVNNVLGLKVVLDLPNDENIGLTVLGHADVQEHFMVERCQFVVEIVVCSEIFNVHRPIILEMSLAAFLKIALRYADLMNLFVVLTL